MKEHPGRRRAHGKNTHATETESRGQQNSSGETLTTAWPRAAAAAAAAAANTSSPEPNKREKQVNAPIGAATASAVTAGPSGEAFANVLSCASAPLAAAVRASRLGALDQGCNGECRERELHGVVRVKLVRCTRAETKTTNTQV